MKIFLDTANREYIKKLLPTGVIDGITTNPSLLSKEGSQTKQVLQDICAMVPGPVSIEVVEKHPDAVLKQAREIAKFAKNIVVKIPFSIEYMPVIKTLAQEGIALNITLVFTPLQALMVAKLGVTFISPFLGRWDDIGVDSIELLEQTIDMKESYDFESEILAASIRTVMQWQQVVQAGANIVTVPPAILEQVFKHPLTQNGIALFDADWQKLGKSSLFE
jgi:transaldolase